MSMRVQWDGINLTRASTFRRRVREWQRDVAGQPVVEPGGSPDRADWSFCKSQLSFVGEELNEELRESLHEYLSSYASYGVDGEEDAEMRTRIADDIGDVAFTIIGYMNAKGWKDEFQYIGSGAFFMHPARLLEKIRMSHELGFMEGGKPAAWSSIADLEALACKLGISFWHALSAVCLSNDSKLWKDGEVEDDLAKTDASLQFVKVPDRGFMDGLRRWRVTRPDGKLVKSPSFIPPDFSEAIGLDAGARGVLV